MTHVCLALIVGIILLFSAVTLGGYNNFVRAQSPPGIGQCRGFNDVKPQIYLVSEHCGIPAPSNQPLPKNPCSDKPGTIFWPSSGGCVPPFCPPGANREIRGARENSGDCAGSGSSVNGNSTTSNQIPNPTNSNNQQGGNLGALPTALGALPPYPPNPLGIPEVGGEPPVVTPGIHPPGVVPAEPPVYEIVVPGEAAAGGGAAAAEGGAALVGEGAVGVTEGGAIVGGVSETIEALEAVDALAALLLL